jgi:hypothetical protein
MSGRQRIRADSVAAFTASCEARAILYAAGELTLHNAVDALQDAAVGRGLVAAIGQDAVQALMSEAFAAVRDDLPRTDNAAAPITTAQHFSPPADEYDGLPSTFAASCRAADAKQARTPPHPDIEKAHPLMADDVSLERASRELNTRVPGDVPTATLQAAEYLIREGDEARWGTWFNAHSESDRAAILKHLEEQRKKRREHHDGNTGRLAQHRPENRRER